MGIDPGCNGGGGLYAIDDGRLLVSDLTRTAMGCDPALEAMDEYVFSLISAAPEIQIDDQLMVLRHVGGDVVLYDLGLEDCRPVAEQIAAQVDVAVATFDVEAYLAGQPVLPDASGVEFGDQLEAIEESGCTDQLERNVIAEAITAVGQAYDLTGPERIRWEVAGNLASLAASGASTAVPRPSQAPVPPGTDFLNDRTYVTTARLTDTGEDDVIVVLSFEEGRVNAEVQPACNQISGSYTVSERSHLMVDDASSTERGCPDEVVAEERWLIDFLASSPRITLEDGGLILFDGRDTVVYLDQQR